MSAAQLNDTSLGQRDLTLRTVTVRAGDLLLILAAAAHADNVNDAAWQRCMQTLADDQAKLYGGHR